ncbi:MAG: tRNA (adenosine(37)-N6)-threonylcarbamoyltransferase complex dimerization subunit type 1 TsaB [Clostridia bacterium]|nr:tRNA (adenosine(37)-N6)-threonylcarbamoyltransferase complex dimerization subunit type 1 TsaB [Clostridia bacterium]
MNILAVESSGAAAGAAVLCDGTLRAEGYADTGLTHSEGLLPLIDSVLAASKIKIDSIDAFAVSAGPGSFTGIRIGIGTVKGLAYGNGAKACAVSSLEALCYNVPNSKGVICPMIDARHNEVYNALYKWEDGTLYELCAPRAIFVSELLKELPEGTVFVGDGALAYSAEIAENTVNSIITPPHIALPRASGIALAAVNKNFTDAAEISPIYLKKPQAERELIERNEKK